MITKDEAIKLKDDEINRLKDFKQRLSTKMLGETLEQHCEIEFNKLRATAFNKNVYFEKDNDAKTGSKGDFIYRETDEDGNVSTVTLVHPKETTKNNESIEENFKINLA